MTAIHTNWSQDDIAISVALYRADWPFSKIGRALDKTKNSVVGKVNRMGFGSIARQMTMEQAVEATAVDFPKSRTALLELLPARGARV